MVAARAVRRVAGSGWVGSEYDGFGVLACGAVDYSRDLAR